MFGEHIYITQKFPKAILSQTYWATSKAGVLQIDWSQQGAKAILFNTFIAYSTGVAPVVFTISDAVGNIPLFNASQAGIGAIAFSLTNFHHIIATNQVRLTCNVPGIVFSVGYQYITEK